MRSQSTKSVVRVAAVVFAWDCLFIFYLFVIIVYFRLVIHSPTMVALWLVVLLGVYKSNGDN